MSIFVVHNLSTIRRHYFVTHLFIEKGITFK